MVVQRLNPDICNKIAVKLGNVRENSIKLGKTPNKLKMVRYHRVELG